MSLMSKLETHSSRRADTKPGGRAIVCNTGTLHTFGIKVHLFAVLCLGTRKLGHAHATIVVPITRSDKVFLKSHGHLFGCLTFSDENRLLEKSNDLTLFPRSKKEWHDDDDEAEVSVVKVR